MRILGIDFGTKRIGLAISDEKGILAFPKEIILNDPSGFDRLSEIVKTENISDIVVGESVDFSGKLNVLSARIEIFISELKDKFKLPVHKQKEFLTSVEARRYGDNNHRLQRDPARGGGKNLSRSQSHSKLKDKKRGRVDASAAALILQRYLDKKNKEDDLSR